MAIRHSNNRKTGNFSAGTGRPERFNHSYGHMTSDRRRNHQKIPVKDDDFSMTDDALAEAEDSLIVHIMEKRVTEYRSAMNYTGTHWVTQRQGMGQGQNISATKIP